VDRLDYTKGIELRLLAFREMLKQHPEFRGKVSLCHIAVPTRTDVEEYKQLKENIDKLVGEINGEFGRPNYTPVQYLFTFVSFPELMALYCQANVLLVTSKRDGMNLVALEYLAAQDPDDPGVVLLSEFTGAVSTLSHVVPINPWDISETSALLARALRMQKQERIDKHRPMLEFLKKYTATEWAEGFMRSLRKSGEQHKKGSSTVEIKTTSSGIIVPQQIKTKLTGRKLLLFIDYDGTLVSITDDPDKAVIDDSITSCLSTLINSKKCEIMILSGRKSAFISKQFKNMNLSLVAEDGAKFFDNRIKKWLTFVHMDTSTWYNHALRIMEIYAARVPGSIIEQKEFSLSWHYRKSPLRFAAYQSNKMKDELENGLSNEPVTIHAYNKVIEARSIEANKTNFVRWYLSQKELHSNTLIVAFGDDQSDEELFAFLPDEAISIKIGDEHTQAEYCLKNQNQVKPFLNIINELINIKKD